MKKKLGLFEALIVGASLIAGVGILSCAPFAWFRGDDWQAVVFLAGGLYLGMWAAARLSAAAPERW